MSSEVCKIAKIAFGKLVHCKFEYTIPPFFCEMKCTMPNHTKYFRYFYAVLDCL